MTDYDEGDYVEALASDELPAGLGGPKAIVQGAVYRVWRILQAEPGNSCSNNCDKPRGVILQGEPESGPWFWCSCGFRPIYKPDERLLQLLAQPAPAELERA